MSLLGWRNTNDEYMGGNYRIRLVRAGCWEIRYRSEPVAMADGLKLAMSRAELDYRERLRNRDVVGWGTSSAVFGVVLLWMASTWTNEVGFFFLFTALFWGLLNTLTRFIAATGWSQNDPYRRRLPWERRDWYEHS
jgi:hypothetical protein